MATKSISQLDTQATANETDLFEVAIVDANSASGYASKKESAAAIADAIVGEYQYPLRITGTTAKTIAGAINELKNLVDLLPQFAIEVVNTLPVSDISETTIYLVPASDPEQGNYYEEYIYVNNAWELVGTTAVDLSGYYTSAQVDTLLAAKANTSSLATVATSGAYSDLTGKPTIDTALDTTSTNAVENKAIAEAVNGLDTRLTNAEYELGMIGNDIWGIEVDYENDVYVRLGGAVGKTAGADFDTFEPFKRRRCTLADDGTVNHYYGETGYAEDGTDGQVMVEQPAFWYKVVPMKLEKNTDSGIGYHTLKARYYVSATPKKGFKLHPAFYGSTRPIYLSAYEGSYYDSALDKIFDDDYDTSTTVNAGDKGCSLSGVKPISGKYKNLTKATLETIAQNRGSNWHLETVQTYMLNMMLYIIEYGGLNSQSLVGRGICDYDDPSSTYNCAALTGSTTSLGNASGSASSTTSRIGNTYPEDTTYTTSGKVSVSYRGQENIWGDLWKHINGINLWGDGTMAGGQAYICSDFGAFNESKRDNNYVATGITLAAANGYVKYVGYSEEFDWLFLTSKTGGNQNGFGDYTYLTANLNGYRIALLGGGWDNGSGAGALYWRGGYGVGYRRRDVGGRFVKI